MGRYDDIIDLPHHVSERRPRMPMIDRAAQFSPFAALTGYDGVIRETGRLTDQRIELTEDARAELDRKQQILEQNLLGHPHVTVTYFAPDRKKTGGSYITVSGRIKKIDNYQRILIFEDGSVISQDEIIDLSGSLWE